MDLDEMLVLVLDALRAHVWASLWVVVWVSAMELRMVVLFPAFFLTMQEGNVEMLNLTSDQCICRIWIYLVSGALSLLSKSSNRALEVYHNEGWGYLRPTNNI
jgi:hypothetical protein